MSEDPRDLRNRRILSAVSVIVAIGLVIYPFAMNDWPQIFPMGILAVILVGLAWVVNLRDN